MQSSHEDYSILKAHINIPWDCKFIKYYISSLNTKVNVLVCTNEDRIVFDTGDQNVIINFTDCYNITHNEIVALFGSVKDLISITYDTTRRVFKLVPRVNLTLLSITHRASLLLGLFNEASPIRLYANEPYYCPDIPILDYGNKFYLVSLQGQALGASIRGEEYTPSIIANIDTFMKDNLPMLVNFDSMSKPIKIRINVDGMKYLEMQLVDFMFQPIIIKSPVFVTLKIKPCKAPSVKSI